MDGYDGAGGLSPRFATANQTIAGSKGLRVTITEDPKAAGEPNRYVEKQYDLAGRLAFFNANAHPVQYEYYRNDLIKKVIYPYSDREVEYAYDDLNRLTTVTDTDGLGTIRTTTFEYYLETAAVGSRNRLKQVNFPNGTYRIIQYRANGEMGYTADRSATDEWITDNVLLYDRVGQLVGETILPWPEGFVDTLPTGEYGYDPDNRLVNFNGETLSFDDDGNLTYGPLPNGALGSFAFDARNRLIGAHGATYAYGPENRRTHRTLNGITTKFATVPLFGRDEVIQQLQFGSPDMWADFIYAPATACSTKCVIRWIRR